MEGRLALVVWSVDGLREVFAKKLDHRRLRRGSSKMKRGSAVSVDRDSQIVTLVGVDPVCDFSSAVMAE